MIPTSSSSSSSAENRRQQVQALKERLRRLASLSPNKVCSECPESNPTWASILQPPVQGGQRLGVLCCYKCSTFHFQLGRNVCTVKNIKMIEEWTEEDIETIERGGGNQIINALYEAGLNSVAYNKWMVLEDPQEEDSARKEFIQNKYQNLEYFDPILYQAHLHRSASRNNNRNSSNRPTRQARRCRSFEDQNSQMVEGKGRRDFVRKPMRRRSQSFQEQDRLTTDDESTDDDQRLSYNLPGHLTGMSASAPDANGRTRRTKRSSMPGLMTSSSANNHNRSNVAPRERKQRRASVKSSIMARKEALPSDAELGYGGGMMDQSGNSNSNNTDMDSTRRRSNRRRDGRDNDNMMNSSSSRWRSGRRNSLPSMGLGAPPPSPSSSSSSSSYYSNANAASTTSTCQSNAPKMPTRCISDESGEDDMGNETDDTGFMSPPPTAVLPAASTKTINDRIPRRVRRMSMPAGMSSSDEDDSIKGHAYSPSLPRLTRFETDRSNKSKSLYGMDLGYGYDRNTTSTTSSSADKSGGTNYIINNPQEQQVEVKPARMPRLPPAQRTGVVNGGGGPAFKRSVTNPCRPPPKLLMDSDSAMSSDEVSYGFPSPRKTHQNRRKRTSRTNRRTMRRCSTGGALDKFCNSNGDINRRLPSPESSFEGTLTRRHFNEDTTTDDGESDAAAAAGTPPQLEKMHRQPSSSFGPPTLATKSTTTNNQTQTTLQNLVNTAMGNQNRDTSAGGGDFGYYYDDDTIAPPNNAHHDDDELPSMEDLGYGDFGGHESMGSSIMSIDTTISKEELGYLDYGSLLGGGRFIDNRRQDQEGFLSNRMPRRCSTGGGGTHRRRSTTGMPRRGSTTATTNGTMYYGGPACSQQRAGRRRLSHKAGDEGGQHHHSNNHRGPGGSSQHHQPQRRPRRRSSVGGGGLGAALQQQPRAAPGMLGGTGILMRADSLSSIGSEVSVNAALLYAGGAKNYYNNNNNNNSNGTNQDRSTGLTRGGMKDDSNASPVCVSVVSSPLGYDNTSNNTNLFGKADPLASSEKEGSVNPADSESTAADQIIDPARNSKGQSKKDYWKSKLHETTSPTPVARQDDDILSYGQRRARRKSMTTACA